MTRPTIKVTEYECYTAFGGGKLYWTERTKNQGGSPTGNKREFERLMNDTEYIEYLEDYKSSLEHKLKKSRQQTENVLNDCRYRISIIEKLEKKQEKFLELTWHTIVDFELTNDITNEKETLAPHIVSLIVDKIKEEMEK